VNFKGMRDIHLSPEQRIADRRKRSIEESSRGTSGRDNRNRNQQGTSRFAGVAEFKPPEEELHKMVGNLEEELAFLMEISDDLEGSEDDEIRIGEKVKVDAVALNLDVPQDDSVNHDTGATRHIFREKKLFHNYTELENPLQVHGFGSKLSAVAVGKGTIVLEATMGKTKRTFSLSNVLHIPSARCNLISGSRIDKKGVSTRTGDGKITYYSAKNTPFARGIIVRDLYRMDVVPV